MSRSPEQNPIPPGVKETRQPKVEFDWNKHLKAEWEELEPLLSELKSLIIEGPNGNVDVLKVVGAKEVFLRYTGERGGDVSVKGDVIMTKFDNVLDLAYLMHEFGHVDQFIHGNFDLKILKLALDVKIAKDSDNPKARVEVAQHVIEMFPEVRPLIRSGLINETNSKEIIDLPTKIMERGATAQALKYFREISNKTGIDFFKKFKTENPDYFNWEEELKSADDCQSSMKEGIEDPDKFADTTIVQELNNALKTYHAETLTDTYDPAKTGKRIKPKLDTK